ncbi:mitochondrial antiviral-signaling protein-like [Etheostoma cragini]|uniref:mitochondrial antiviral-signaling protein-like n=1 Tax=Etheostoma cragini TaxID=417921 RepID=UPI00155DE10B|nr:mitochondrial antiviral-signaling protein-like [Etheostoma cragini]
MSFASDELYNGYLRRNMPSIVTRVKPTQIMIHLPCLTAHDRENIEAKRESYGNYDSMVVLLDCLKRRGNWPEEFIEALEACEHPTLAAEIRAEYNALRGINSKSFSQVPTVVLGTIG